MEIIKNEGVFRLFDKHSTVILTDEKQLDRIIAGPDTPLFVDEDLGHSFERIKLNSEEETLRSKCREAAERGCTRMEVSYDFFFGGSARHNYPSDETTIKAFKVIRDTAKEYGMDFGASILSPLDVGGGWAKLSNETGFSYQFQETEIHPNGTYCANMRCQRQWYNNKGPIALTPYKVLVYAFNEQRVGDSSYFYVDENAIADISATAACTIREEETTVSSQGYGACPMRIYGKWPHPTANRALCIMVYRTPELDYFAPSAPAFMKQVLDMHNEAGIDYGGFYSDEMHIQFDWDLEAHFGKEEVTTRYLTPNLAAKYADLYGEKFRDFAKYLIYMAYSQHDFLSGEAGKEPAQHVFAPNERGIYDTWLFRNRYFELLQSTVVKLACDGKAYAEQLWGAPVMTRAHATWQESPTCDHYYEKANMIGGFDVQGLLGPEHAGVTHESGPEACARLEKAKAAKAAELGISRYDYTPWYDWSSSIRENISACYDYFKWNDFLSGGGTDHAEGGNLDRNYYSQALAASFSELNKFGLAYCAGWGMPKKVGRLFNRVAAAYGTGYGAGDLNFVTGLGTRRTDVLALYPIKLNNVEERFGSWMVQYGYCNYITEEKLLQNAAVNLDGTITVNGQAFRCLMVLFEPFLNEKTFALIEKFLAAGGKVLWNSIPALTDSTGADTAARFADIFGIGSITPACFGQKSKGQRVEFAGMLADIAPMDILTDFVVDAVYPCTPAADGTAVASVAGQTVAVAKRYPSGGIALYSGCRLRDDQSGSLGKDVDSLFRVLCAMGAYRPGSLEVRSRQSGADYVLTDFANGAVACAPHYREVYEAWEGKFFREEEYDAALLADRDIPDGAISLDEEIAGHRIGYTGGQLLAYRLDEAGVPAALYGCGTDGITVDGVKYTYTDRTADFHFAPVPKQYLTAGVQRAVMACCWTVGAAVTVPAAANAAPTVAACTDRVFDPSVPVEHIWNGKTVTYTVTEELAGKNVMIYWQ